MKVKLTETQIRETMPIQQKRLEAGFIGKLFGTKKNAPINITGIIIVLLIIWVIIVWCFDHTSAITLFKMVSPIITLALGFLFGKNS